MTAAPNLDAVEDRMLTLLEAADLLGVGRTLAYELVRTNQWPTPVIRAGRLIRIPSGPMRELLRNGNTSR